jgi:hypothetical protein
LVSRQHPKTLASDGKQTESKFSIKLFRATGR